MKLKKMLALLLALMMALALVACGDTADAGNDVPDDQQVEDNGGDTADTGDTGDTASPEGQSLLDILKDRFVAAPEMGGTYWTFIGGYVKGVQMTEEQTQEVMSQLGDVYQFIFVDDSTVVLAEGEDQTEGTYAATDDENVLDIQVGGVKYAGTFIEQEDGYVLVALLDGTGMNGLYFHLMDDAPEK